MKWFHHECEAKHDLKLQVLAKSSGGRDRHLLDAARRDRK